MAAGLNWRGVFCRNQYFKGMKFCSLRNAICTAILLQFFGGACESWSKNYEDRFVSFTYPDSATVQGKPDSGSYVVIIGESALVVVVTSDEKASLEALKANVEKVRSFLAGPAEKRPEEFREMVVTTLSDLKEVKTDGGTFYLVTTHVQTPDGAKGVLTLGYGSLGGRVVFYQYTGMDPAIPVEQHLDLLKTLRSKGSL
jgi:hypothetical protein